VNLNVDSKEIAARKRFDAAAKALGELGYILRHHAQLEADGGWLSVEEVHGGEGQRFESLDDVGQFIAERQRDAEQPVMVPSMGFGAALHGLKAGAKVTRAGWNGKGMFLYLVPGSTFEVNRPPLLGIYEAGTQISYLPHIDLRTADGSCVPWAASQADLLAQDWSVIP
jgi:hypothetical protein